MTATTSPMTTDPADLDNDVRHEAESLIVMASKNGGRIHRAKCAHLPKTGDRYTADQWDADELAAAKRATCCSPSARLVEMYVDWRRATGTPATPITVPDGDNPPATIDVPEKKATAKRAPKAKASVHTSPADGATPADTRTCTGACGETKPITSFPTIKPRKDGETRGTECRACRDKRTADRKAKKA